MSEEKTEPPTEEQREKDVRALARELYVRLIPESKSPIEADAKFAFDGAEAFFAECAARDAARKGGAK